MSVKQKIAVLLPLLPMMLALQSCGFVQYLKNTVVPPAEPQIQIDSSHARPARFRQSDQKAPTAVESAIELSQKYAKVSDEASVLRQEKDRLTTENHLLKQQLIQVQAEFENTKQHLAKANEMLVEMRIELNNWKLDILGFRDEIRYAEQSQMEALSKIVEFLGGEVAAGPLTSQNTRPLSYTEPNYPGIVKSK